MVFEVQQKIKVRGKEFIVSFHKLGLLNNEWFTAYVYFEGIELRDEYSYMDFSYCTYNEDNVWGIDTNHLFNDRMTLEEKYRNAEEQIKSLIKSLLSEVENE